jgi:hypothetical protein
LVCEGYKGERILSRQERKSVLLSADFLSQGFVENIRSNLREDPPATQVGNTIPESVGPSGEELVRSVSSSLAFLETDLFIFQYLCGIASCRLQCLPPDQQDSNN